ncbi:hypothetical protein J2Z49_002730 [Desulfofundulus luciae]|uniref:Uncharacterized protein n=1 Tax=Desulfofundulus luciae TaxID=74702 RepID=A0ABU0B4G4_9FIRM|nr:hypothetical protein [Desulfofundulus luciae]
MELRAGLAGKTPAGVIRAGPEAKPERTMLVGPVSSPRPVLRDTGQEGAAGQSPVVKSLADFAQPREPP